MINEQKAKKDLIKRMKKLCKRPLPTLEQVKEEWKASIDFSNKIISATCVKSELQQPQDLNP
jgi:hypothetical protein